MDDRDAKERVSATVEIMIDVAEEKVILSNESLYNLFDRTSSTALLLNG